MNKKKELFYEGITSDGKRIWYLTYEIGMIIETLASSGETRAIGKVPGYERLQFAYRYLFYYNNSLILIPYEANELAIYDLNLCKFKKYQLPEDILKEYKRPGMVGGIAFDNNLYIFGENSFICRFDLHIETFEIIKLADKKHHFWRNYTLCDNHLFIAESDCSSITDYNLDNNVINTFVIQDDNYDVSIQSLTSYGTNIYALIKNEAGRFKICIMNKASYDYHFDDMPQIYQNIGKYDVAHIVATDKLISMMPCCSEEIYKYDLQTQIIINEDRVPLADLAEMESDYPLCCNYPEISMYEMVVYAIHYWTGKVICWDLMRDKITCSTLLYDEKYMEEMIKSYRSCDISKENNIYGIDEFIDGLI